MNNSTNKTQSRAQKLFVQHIERINAEIHGHLLPRLAHLINLEDKQLTSEQLFLAMAGLEDLLELNAETMLEVIGGGYKENTENLVEMIRDENCWLDRLLLPLSAAEKRMYEREDKAAPDFRILFKGSDGCLRNYRFYAKGMKVELTILCETLMATAMLDSPSEDKKYTYNQVISAIPYIDFSTKGEK